MDTSRRDLLLSALAASAAAIPLAFAFGHGELERWWHDRPLSLTVLLVTGVLLSAIGAVLVRYVRVPQFEHSSTVGEAVHGGVIGALYGLAAGGVGWVIAETSLWALLIWFFLGAVLVGAALSSFAKRAGRAG
jgi:predicted membrane protein